jgi:hypothetical protein
MFKGTDSVLNSESVSSYVIETLIVSTSLKPAFIFGLHRKYLFLDFVAKKKNLFSNPNTIITSIYLPGLEKQAIF